MKAKLSYTVRSTRAPGETQDTVVPVLVDRLQPVDLGTVVENCIDRGLIAGLKTTAAHTIAEGVAAQLAREFTLGRGVQFGRYFYGRPYLSGTVDGNGRVGDSNGINVRLYKGEAFRLALSDYAMSFDGSGDSVRIESVMGDATGAGGNTRGQVAANSPVVIHGRNFWAAGDADRVTFAEVGAEGGTPVEVTQFTSQGPDILAFAWPGGLVAGRKYSVTVSRTDSNGVTRTSGAKTVEVVANPAPVPAPTITGAGTHGCEPGTVEAPGGVVEMTGTNLESATSIDFLVGDDGAPVSEMELWQTLEATWDAEGEVLVTDESVGESAPGSAGVLRVTTAGGTATYPVQYTVH